MPKDIEIVVRARPGVGKSSVAAAIKDFFDNLGFKASLEDDDISSSALFPYHERLANIRGSVDLKIRTEAATAKRLDIRFLRGECTCPTRTLMISGCKCGGR